MHLLVRETRSLDEDAPAREPGQDPAPLLALSFSDADLGALAAAWHGAGEDGAGDLPPLRLASLARLRHPMSVDLYLEQVAAGARAVVVRLLGGLDYWRYGAEELGALCRDRGIALALVPGDGADDTRLRELSTVAPEAWAAIDEALRAGGAGNAALALRWAAWCAGSGPRPVGAVEAVPGFGEMALDAGGAGGPGAAIVFYRSHLVSADVAPVHALAVALRHRGLVPRAFWVDSLKSPDSAAAVAGVLREWRPAVVLNTTAFSARGEAGSPLDEAGVPVLQAVLSGNGRDAWAASSRGLSPTDLAMQVVLPELDGRLNTAAISFKAEAAPDPALQYARTVHAPDADGVALAADRAAGWARLAGTARADRRLAVVLSDYPGIGGQEGHAVGLDTFASLEAVLGMLAGATLAFPSGEGRGEGLPSFQADGIGDRVPRDRGRSGSKTLTRPSPDGKGPAYDVDPLDRAALVQLLCHAAPRAFMALAEYAPLFAALPAAVQEAVTAAWGAPEDDPAVQCGAFTVRHHHAGKALLALQPDRGARGDRRAGYHDPDTPPRHGFVAFHLWLRHGMGVHALVQVGAHGSLEWLPGKAAAPAASCFPSALLGGLPVVYPFIVNNPGEAAPAKRRLGAVVIGHLTPPLRRAGSHGDAAALERLLDEYAAADGLDRRRTGMLRREILERAESAGLLAESGVARDADPDEALARLDAYLCDVKDLRLRDGLHVFGVGGAACDVSGWAESPAREREALLAALDGRFVQPGPAGAPTRGRADVLPTGRNLATIDPRGLPTRSAVALAEKAAEALLRRHLAEHGEYPRAVLLDVWGSAAMRTGGEELALAIVLLGARPVWDGASGRVSGFEVVPLALLDRPRIDVTLRVSGLFRDAFGAQVALFDQLVRAVAGRDEAADWNPLAGGGGDGRVAPRVYGPAPGAYGAGADWMQATQTAYGAGGEAVPDLDGLAARVAAVDAFVHVQDHAETDVLDGPEVAAHEGGFAGAAAALGGAPALYHLDTADPARPVPRTVAEEVRRVARGRAANPAWIAGQMRHGFRGAAEMARSLAALDAYARRLPERFDAQFDLVHAATLGNEAVAGFIGAENPAALADMRDRFARARCDGLWHPRRNDVLVDAP